MSYDIKYRQRVIDYLSEGHMEKETAETFKISTFTIWKWKSKLNESGTLMAKERKETWRKIDPDKLRKYVEKNPDAYQHEIAAAFGVRLYAIQKALKRLKITRKKTTLYKEINESSRQIFVEMLKSVSCESLIYVDECGIDQYLYREFAYSPCGEKVLAKISGKKFKRTNIVAGICCGKWVAPLEYSSTTDLPIVRFLGLTFGGRYIIFLPCFCAYNDSNHRHRPHGFLL